MFGGITTSFPNQQENIPANLSTSSDDDVPNGNYNEAILLDTMQYPLPSTESITQHQQYSFREATSENMRSGF